MQDLINVYTLGELSDYRDAVGKVGANGSRLFAHLIENSSYATELTKERAQLLEVAKAFATMRSILRLGKPLKYLKEIPKIRQEKLVATQANRAFQLFWSLTKDVSENMVTLSKYGFVPKDTFGPDIARISEIIKMIQCAVAMFNNLLDISSLNDKIASFKAKADNSNSRELQDMRNKLFWLYIAFTKSFCDFVKGGGTLGYRGFPGVGYGYACGLLSGILEVYKLTVIHWPAPKKEAKAE